MQLCSGRHEDFPPPGAPSQAEVQQGEGTGPKPSTPWTSKKRKTNPRTIMFNRSLSTVGFFFLDSRILSHLQLNPKKTEGPNLQVPVPREETHLGHCAWCRPSAPCSAHRCFSSLSQGLALPSDCLGSHLL